jgi:hypothetical protein
MARLFLTPIDLNLNELRQAVVHLLASDPSSPIEAQLWYNSTTHRPKIRLNGVTFDFTDSLTLGGQAGSYYLARGNHTGSQLASTISDFDTQVRTNRLDQMSAPTAAVSWNNQKITSLANGTSPADAVNKGQLDAAVQGFSWKDAVRAASTANVTVGSGPNSMDGVSLVNGDRVLLKDQTTQSQNGIYVWNGVGATMTRALDSDSGAELENATVFVDEGTANAGTAWNQTADAVSVGSTNIVWVQFGAGTTFNFVAPLNLSGNTVTLTLSSRLVNNGSNQLDLASGIVTPGTYDSVTVDTYGRVTAASNPTKVNRYSALIGNGVATSITITQATHGLAANGTNVVIVYDATSGNKVEPDTIVNPGSGDVTLGFGSYIPTVNQYRVVILG